MNDDESGKRIRRAMRVASAGAMALAFAFLAGCGKEEAPQMQVTVQAEHPETGPIAEHVTADAILQPMAQAALVPRVSAPVKQFYVQRGSHVKAGELLAVLDNSDLKAAALDTQGSYEAAQAAYATATKAQVPMDVLTAQSDLEQAKANLALDQSIVKSRTELFAEGAIPGRDLDTAKAQLVQAQAAYDAADKHMQAIESVTRQASLDAAQGQLKSAQGKYEGAEAQVNFSEIRSPINGVVTDRPLFAGETAAAGSPLITVMDTSSLLAKTHVAQSMAQQLKLGSQAQVTVPGIDDPVPATVSMISPALDPGSTTVEIWLKVNNKSGALKVGTPVKLSINGRAVPKALTIPLSAVLTADNGAKSVMVLASDGTAQPKAVKLGITNGEDVQVLSGLTPQDQVITTGSYGMDPGTKVKVGPAEADDDDAGAKGGGKD
jgi:HlyD family secretion protein